jgi:choline dehydrogenase-like flavoprotein
MQNINHFDVCVVGAGPAGMVSAIELADNGLSVALIESGNEGFYSVAQSLSDGEIVSPYSHSIMADAVRRGLGGTTELWGGRCVPLDKIDHQIRPNVEFSGWPVSHGELAPYYQAACVYLGVNSADFTVASCKSLYTANLPLSAKFNEFSCISATELERWSIEPKIWRVLGTKIKQNPNITLFNSKTCVGFRQLRGESKVSSAFVKATKANAVIEEINAEVFVLACGGVESTRLILSSLEDQNGLNVSGAEHVGRYYMGHPSGKIADIELFGEPNKTLYGFEKDDDVYVRRRITFTEETLKKELLLNIAFWLDNPNLADWQHGSGILSAAYLALTTPVIGNFLAPAAIRKRVAGLQAANRLQHLKNCIEKPIDTITFVTKFIYGRYFAKTKLPGFFTYSQSNQYALHYHAEQVPSRDSCITLSETKDALGLKRAKISLIWSQQDINSIIQAHKVLDNELSKNGIGRLIYKYSTEQIDNAIRDQALDGFHQIGTLRMADSSENGVTDSNGCIFGATNFFVASSAIFPTSGQANPTLALVALAIRQAEHISKKLNLREVI